MTAAGLLGLDSLRTPTPTSLLAFLSMRARIPCFTPADVELHRKAVIAQERADAAERARAGGADGKFPRGAAGRRGTTRDRIGQKFGLSGRTVEKIAEIYAAVGTLPAAIIDPIIEEMNRTEKIDGAHRRMRRALDEVRVLGLAPIAGRFLTLVLDPPWQDETVSEAQRPPYATMPLDEIRAIPVPNWQRDEGHIYVHAPGPWLGEAIALVKGWGYAFKTVLTWQKSRWSRGRYFRVEDEFVAFGTRGGLMTRRQDLSNHFAGPVGEHSAKPESFYQLVLAASPPSYGEAFGRLPRADFRPLYVAAPTREAAE